MDRDRAEAWKEKSEAVFTVAPGLEVRVCRPDAMTFLQCGMDPIIFDVTKPQKVREERLKKELESLQAADLPRLMGFMQAILKGCMVDPKLWTGDPAKCPEGHVTMQHLGGFAEVVFLKAWSFLDLDALKGVADQAATFRPDTNGQDGEQGGPAVPGDPQPAAEAGPGGIPL